MMQLQLKNFNSATYKTIYLEGFPIERAQAEGFVFYTFNNQQYLNMYNGTVLEVLSRSIVSLHDILPHIRNVRNRDTYIIAKRKNPLSPLRRVRFLKRK